MGPGATNLSLLVNPPDDEFRQRAAVLRSRYKMDPAIMQEIESKYARLEWRLPEPHALYWGYVGLRESKPDPRNKTTLINLRRVIYQSLQALTFRGRVMSFTRDGRLQAVPILDLIPVVNETYLQMVQEEETGGRFSIEQAYRSFLREAVYQLYINNRRAESEKWYEVYKTRFPEFLEGAKSLEEFAFLRIRDALDNQNGERIRVILYGLIRTGLSEEALDREEDARNYLAIARSIYDAYLGRFGATARVPLPPWEEMMREALCETLNPESGVYPEYAARIMTRRGIKSLAEVCPQLVVPTDISKAATNKVQGFLPVAPPK